MVRPVLVDRGVGRVHRLRRQPGQTGEDLVEVHGGGERPARVQQGTQAACLLLLLAEQARVADRRRRRTGEQAKELLLLRREAAVAARLDHAEHAHRFAGERERHLHDRLLVVPDHDLALEGIQVLVVDVRLEQVALADDGVALRTVVQAHHGAQVVQVDAAELLGPDGDVGHRPRHGVVLVDVAPLHVERLAHLAGDRLHHLVQVEGGRKRGPHLEDDAVRVARGGGAGVVELSHRRPPPGSCPDAWRGTAPCRRCARARPVHRRRRGSRRPRCSR